MVKSLLALLVTTGAFAQNIELHWAEKIKTKEPVYVLGGQGGKYYTRHSDKDDRLVCRIYNHDLQLVNEKPIEFNVDSKKRMYRGAYFLKDKIVHFIQENARKEDKDYLYGSITDLNLKPNPKVFELDVADDDARSFGLRSISPDSTKILILNESKERKKDPSQLHFKVYNAELNERLYDRSVILPIKAGTFSREAVEVDNYGNVYVLARIGKEKEDRQKDHSLFLHRIYVFSAEGEPKQFDFDFPDREVESIDIIAGPDNTLVCTGFLKILKAPLFKGKLHNISDELFATTIDCKTISVKSANKYELPNLYPEKPKKSEDYVPYKIRNIFPTRDGGSVVVAEQYKLVVTTHHTPQGTHTIYTYYYCDIATIQINNKSEVVAVSKMPKYQKNAGNASIKATHYNDRTYIIYEDLEKNALAENDKETKRSSKSMFSSDSKNAFFLLTVEPGGEMKKDVIYSYKESKLRPRIRASVVCKPNEFILNADDQIGVLRIL